MRSRLDVPTASVIPGLTFRRFCGKVDYLVMVCILDVCLVLNCFVVLLFLTDVAYTRLSQSYGDGTAAMYDEVGRDCLSRRRQGISDMNDNVETPDMAGSGGAATSAELPYARGLQSVLDLAVRVTGGTGASAAVIVPEQGVWSGASGISEPNAPITPDMLFDVASIGKNCVAALVLQLAEEGELGLDDPLHKWLPEYEHIDSAITIRQLLNHTSGVHDFVEHPQSPYRTPFAVIDFGAASSPEEVVSTLVGEPYFPPGDGFRYSSTNYVLLRMIVEQVTGSKVSTAIRDRLLDPLGLDHTIVLDSHAFIPKGYRVAHDWWDADGDGLLDDVSSRPRTWIATRSPALIYTTAGDLARWSQALYRGEVLGRQSMAQMLTFHRPVPGAPGEPLATGYGLGSQELRLGGLVMWGHLGWQYGYTSAMLYIPKRSVSITVLINDNNMALVNLAPIGLWLVTEYQRAKARFIVVGIGIVLLLSVLFLWLVKRLTRRLRNREAGTT
jgi:D-alanyl-D-alanine carboxypeptidase